MALCTFLELLKWVLRDSSEQNVALRLTDHQVAQMCRRKYLISANESSAKSSKNVDYNGTAVAPDRIIRSDLGHVCSPANVLPHYNSEVRYEERVLLSLTEGGKRIWLKQFPTHFSKLKQAWRHLTRVCS